MELILAVVILVALLGLWVVLPSTKKDHKAAHTTSSVASFQRRA